MQMLKQKPNQDKITRIWKPDITMEDFFAAGWVAKRTVEERHQDGAALDDPSHLFFGAKIEKAKLTHASTHTHKSIACALSTNLIPPSHVACNTQSRKSCGRAPGCGPRPQYTRMPKAHNAKPNSVHLDGVVFPAPVLAAEPFFEVQRRCAGPRHSKTAPQPNTEPQKTRHRPKPTPERPLSGPNPAE